MSRDLTAAPPSESGKRISREEIGELPIRRYEGSVHIVAGHRELQHAMQDILQESVVGFDIETAADCGRLPAPSIAGGVQRTAFTVPLTAYESYGLWGTSIESP
jgi:hypothetical protein